MKKNYIWPSIIVIAIILSIVTLVLLNKSSNYYMKDITVKEYQTFIEENKTFILYVKQDGCSHCEAFTPIFKQVLSDNKVTAYVINLSKLSTEDNKIFEELVNVEGTPTTVFYKDGKSISTVEGSKSATFMQSKLETLGYLK